MNCNKQICWTRIKINSLSNPTCSTLINFLSFAQLSLISKNMSALTLSLPFSKIECAPDHHSFIKSALFFRSFFFQNSNNFMSSKFWNWMPCSFIGPKHLWWSKTKTKNLIAFIASSKTFVLAQKWIYSMKIIFWSSTKCLWPVQYKFMAGLKFLSLPKNWLIYCAGPKICTSKTFYL